MNHYKISGIDDPFKELSFFISPESLFTLSHRGSSIKFSTDDPFKELSFFISPDSLFTLSHRGSSMR